MTKRALTLSLTGVLALSAITTGVVANAEDSGGTSTQAAAVVTSAPTKDSKSQDSEKKADEAKQADAAKKDSEEKATKALWTGTTTASYFWDDGSGVAGDTGAPASGKEMQKGLFASPSWPMNTKVKVTYNGRSVVGFVGDRGPGEPSHRGVMLDLDTYTFRYLYDGKQPSSNYNTGTDAGHLNGVKVEVLEWGTGSGNHGAPQPL